jgi:hypothetical protein
MGEVLERHGAKLGRSQDISVWSVGHGSFDESRKFREPTVRMHELSALFFVEWMTPMR